MTFSWVPPVDKGGVELLSYKIYFAADDDVFTQITTAPASTNPTITVHTQENLINGATYKFKVSAVNEIGESLYSDEIQVIASDLPEQP